MENYSLSQEIGRGKYSVVYKGRRKQTTEYLAIKSVDKERRGRVINEVSILQELVHANTLRVFNWYETTNHLWLVMELCTGGDLLTLITQDGKLPECTIQLFGRDLLAGLHYAHSKGIVYCDLKPSTILIDGGGNLKYADFGLAKRVANTNTVEQKTQGERRGTPFYMAPELFQEGVHSYASDLYSLGCVLYELASGSPPYVESSISMLMQAVVSNPYPPLAHCSAQLNDLLSGLLRKEPSDRLSWRALLDHPFWDFRLDLLPLPRQPQYEAVLLRRKQNQHLGRTESVMRMSRNAQRNLKHEESDDNYTSKSSGSNDIMLSNTNMELDFADEHDLRRAAESPTEGYDVEDLEESSEVEPLASSVPASSSPIDKRAGSSGKDGNSSMKEPSKTAKPRPSDEDVVAKELTRSRLKSSGGESDRSDRSDRGDRSDRSDRADKIGTDKIGTDRIGTDRSDRLEKSDKDRREATSAPSQTTNSGSPLSSLMWHTSDVQIQPIIQNRKIEILEEHTFNPKSLPFPTFALPQVLAMNPSDLQNFLGMIYKTLSSKSTIAHKLNALSYFETLCTDSQAANMLVHSPMLGLMVRQLKSTKSNSMRARLALLIGLLVRWATEINQQEISKIGLMDVLVTQLRERTDEKVRRRLMAALGELLFYAATQEDDGTQSWVIPPTTLSTLVKFAQHDDEIVKHYATKVIENIASHSPKYAVKIVSGNKEIGNILLVTMSSNPKNEALKATAASALARLSRHSPGLIHGLLEKHGSKLITQVISAVGVSTRIQLAYLNLLNITLLSDAPQRIITSLTTDQGLISDLIGFLDHGMTVLRAKALVALGTLSKLAFRCLLWGYSFKLLPALERIEREKEQEQKDSYLKQCSQALTDVMTTAVGAVTAQIAADLRTVLAVAGGSTSASGLDLKSLSKKKLLAAPALKSLKEHMSYFAIVLHVVASVVYRLRAFTTQTIADLAEALTHTHHLLSFLLHQQTDPRSSTHDLDNASANTIAELEEFHNNLVIVLEGLSQNATVLHAQHEIVLSRLLPALLGQLEADDGDVRLVCLRAFIDIITNYITLPDLYDSPLGPPTSPSTNFAKLSLNNPDIEPSRSCTKQINDLIEKLLLPRYSEILNDADPIPIFGLKLLNIILERNPTFISTVNRLNLTQKFFDFFQLDNPNNNITNIKLIKKLVESPDIDKKILFQNGIVVKLTSILVYSYENNVDQFFEPLLDIMYLLLRYTYNYSQRASHTVDQYQQLLGQVRGLGVIPIVTLVGSLLSSAAELDHAPVVERCSRIAYLLSKLFNTSIVKDAIFSSMSDEALLACLTEEASGGCSRSAAEPLLKLLLASSPQQGQAPSAVPPVSAPTDKHVIRLKNIEGLSGRLKQLCISGKDNVAISKLATDVWKLYFS